MAKIEMRTMGFIGQTSHPRIMSHADNGPQVTAYSVIGRVIDQYGYGVRIFLDGPRYLLALHTQRNAQPCIDFRIDIYRYGSTEHQSIDDTFMDIARQDDFISPLTDGQYHALHGTGRSADHQKGMGGPKGLCCQFFRLADDRNRMTQIIQRFHTVHVNADATLP